MRKKRWKRHYITKDTTVFDFDCNDDALAVKLMRRLRRLGFYVSYEAKETLTRVYIVDWR